MAHGFGRCEKVEMSDIYSVSPNDIKSHNLLQSMIESGEWGQQAHPSRRAWLEYADYLQEAGQAEKLARRIGKLFSRFGAAASQVTVIVTYFLKREAGKDRPLFQVGEEYNLPAMVALLPYSQSIYHHEDISIGACGEKTFTDVAFRMRSFRVSASSVCQDHCA